MINICWDYISHIYKCSWMELENVKKQNIFLRENETIYNIINIQNNIVAILWNFEWTNHRAVLSQEHEMAPRAEGIPTSDWLLNAHA